MMSFAKSMCLNILLLLITCSGVHAVECRFAAPDVQHFIYSHSNPAASYMRLFLVDGLGGEQTIKEGVTSVEGKHRLGMTNPPYYWKLTQVEGSITNTTTIAEATNVNYIVGDLLFSEDINASGLNVPQVSVGVTQGLTFAFSNFESTNTGIYVGGLGEVTIQNCSAINFGSEAETLAVNGCVFSGGANIYAGSDIELISCLFNSQAGELVYGSTVLNITASGTVIVTGCEIAGDLELTSRDGAIAISGTTIFGGVRFRTEEIPSSISFSASTILGDPVLWLAGPSYNDMHISFSGVFWGSGKPGGDNGWLRYPGVNAGTSPASSGTFMRLGADQPRGIPLYRIPALSRAVGHVVLNPWSMIHNTFLREDREFGMSFNLIANVEELTGVSYELDVAGTTYQPAGAYTARGLAGVDIPVSGNEDRTLNFRIPGMDPGTYEWTLTADFSNLRSDLIKPLSTELGSGTFTIETGFARPLRVGVIEVIQNTDGTEARCAPRVSNKHAERIRRDLATLLPLNPSEISVSVLDPYYFDLTTLSSWFTASLMNQLAAELKYALYEYNSTAPVPLDFLIAVCPVNALGGADGVNMGLRRAIVLVDEFSPDAIMHELGHAMGLYTSIFGGEQYSQEGDTYGGKLIKDAGLNLWGFAAFNSSGYSHGTLPAGSFRHFQFDKLSGVYDIMGAKPAPLWIAPDTHNVMNNWLAANLGKIPAEGKIPLAEYAKGDNRIITVAALYTHDSTNGFLIRPETVFVKELPHSKASSLPLPPHLMNLFLQCMDSNNQVISSVQCRADSTDNTDSGIWIQPFVIPANTAILRLYQVEPAPQPGVIWLNQANAEPPETNQLWVAYNPTNDTYEFQFTQANPSGKWHLTLLASSDDGSSWRSINLPSRTNQFYLTRDSLSGTNLLFKLMTSDGLTTVFSGISTVTVTQASAPLLDIVSPQPGSAGSTGTVWRMEAAVSEGSVTSALWTSSLSGMLGNDLVLTNVLLAAGNHVITCIASNSSAMASTASVDVVVSEALTNLDLSIDSTDINLTAGSPEARNDAVAFGQTNTMDVFVRNQGITNTITLQFFVSGPGFSETNFASVTETIGPFDTGRFSAYFLAGPAGTYTCRAAISATSVPDPVTGNNEASRIFANQPPAVSAGFYSLSSHDLPAFIPVRVSDPNLDSITLAVQSNAFIVSVSNNPAGVMFGNQPDAGTHELFLTAADGSLTSSVQRLTIEVKPPLSKPVITSPSHYDVLAASPLSVSLETANPPCIFPASELTPGLTVGLLDGAISGTISSAGLYDEYVTVQNGQGSTNWHFTIRAHDTAPFFYSSQVFSTAQGVAFTNSIYAEGYPVYSSTNLPPGTALDPVSGQFTGLVNSQGIWHFTVSASNPAGVTVTNGTLTVGPPPPDNDDFANAHLLAGSSAVTNSTTKYATQEPGEPDHAGAAGVERSLWWWWVAPSSGLVRIETSNESGNVTVPAVYTGSTLPGLLAVAGTQPDAADSRSIVLFTAAQGQTYRIAVDSFFGVDFSLMLEYPSYPMIVAPRFVRGAQGQPLSSQVVVTNGTGEFSASGLPPGLEINSTSGLISGSPSVCGNGLQAAVTVSNAMGSDCRIISFTIDSDQYPVITSDLYAAGAVEQPFSYAIQATYATPGYYSAWPLPPGLGYNNLSGIISGTPTEAGDFVSEIRAWNTNTWELAVTNLQITIRPSYSNWIAGWGFSTLELADITITGAAADADRDGRSNALEHMRNTDPRRRQAPAWWQAQDVLQAGAVTNDYASCNAGQLKAIASAARDAMHSSMGLDTAAGTNINAMVNAFATTNNFSAVNIGQVKNVAMPFYDRLMETDEADLYPWTGAPATNDFGAANIGQVKHAFSFDVPE